MHQSRPSTNLASLLTQSLSLALLRRPRTPLQPATPSALLLAIALHLMAGLTLDAWLLGSNGHFHMEAAGSRLLPILLCLPLGMALAWAARRPALWLRLALLALLATLPLQLCLTALALDIEGRLPQPGDWGLALIGLYLAGVLLQLMRAAGGQRRIAQGLAGFLGVLLLLGPALLLQPAPWWYSWDEEWSDPSAAWHITPEGLFYSQPARIDQRLADIAPQRPGVVDLYLLAFAGDGSERVFRNEVEYAQRLFDQRFGTRGRSLVLANSETEPEAHPLASIGNLRLALRGLAERMDVEEDVLLLFLTSHGSEEHELYVGLQPLPLDQIDALNLRAALDEAGIRHRVLVVSACYSGGFIPLLEGPDTLILTAARADRSSFGCGADSDISWFGQAFMAEALNAETDFVAAFERARKAIRQRERENGFTASHPQIRVGEGIGETLARWRAGIEPGEPVD
jgi:hypothetical protein